MDFDRFLQLSANLLHEVTAISVRDLWSWQGLAAMVIVGLTALYARRIRAKRAEARARGGSAGAGLLRALVERLTPSGLLCVLTLVTMGVSQATGGPAVVLIILLLLGGLMLVVRLVLYIIVRAKAPPSQFSLMERVAGWLVWSVMALLLFKWMSPAINAVDAIAIPVAGTRVSLLDAIRVVAVLLLFIVAATWLGALIERRVLAISGLPIGMRVGVAKVTRVILVVMAILLALTAVGMDLTALTVIGGAVGVGIGFGLQRVASNFISGFVLLGDRSIRPGDVITIGTRFGVVQELRARYVVVRDRDGVDTLVPNENIITSEVVNWSYGDRRIRLKLPVRISYQDNPRTAMALMETAAKTHPRVEKDPAPAARVMSFADSSIELELRFWIRDPEDGVNNVRSDLFLAIWDAFEAAAITIPYPQRVVHLQGSASPATPAGN